jgi:hypothetical protein
MHANFPPAVESLELRRMFSLTVDLRLSDGSKTVVADHVGQVINIWAWAQPRGTNANLTDEGFSSLFASFLSTDVFGGAVKGDLKATRLAPHNALSSSNGQQVDLDGDGDLDVGSNPNRRAKGYFFARFDPRWDRINKMPRGQEHRFARLTFTVTALLDGDSTEINFRRRDFHTNEMHMEDGKIIFGKEVLSGEPIRVVQAGTGRDSTPGGGSGGTGRSFSSQRFVQRYPPDLSDSVFPRPVGIFRAQDSLG